MDDDTIDRLAAKFADALSRAIISALSQAGFKAPPVRLSRHELEQRRTAGRISAVKRSAAKAVADAKRLKKATARVHGPLAEVPVISETSTEPLQRESNGPLTKERPLSTEIFLQYAAAYKLRYGVFPVRNAKINGMLGKYMQRVPHAEAPEVAAFYVAHNRGLYVSASHPIDLLLRDAESLRMEWATGRKTITKVNGSHTVSVAQSWWESWSGLVEQGNELGIEEGDNPTTYRFEVLRAAFMAGRLPEEIATKLGVGDARAD